LFSPQIFSKSLSHSQNKEIKLKKGEKEKRKRIEKREKEKRKGIEKEREKSSKTLS
jgi:hypothetical protein